MVGRTNGSIQRKALVALAVVGALALQPLGVKAADPVIVRGKVTMGEVSPTVDRACVWNWTTCDFFRTNKCFNDNPSLRKDLFDADPDKDPREESWGGRYPPLNIKDISKYTTRDRLVKFTYDGTEGAGPLRELYADLYGPQCNDRGQIQLIVVEGQTKTIPIPKNVMWFTLWCKRTGGIGGFCRDEKWHLEIPQ